MTQSPVWHPFTQHGLGDPIPQIERAEGAALYTADKRRIVDAISSWWVTTHGHCHPRIAAAIAEQAGKLDQMIFAGWKHEPAEQLALELRRILPDQLSRVFFSDSGSTAVEVALKMALGFWKHQWEERSRIVVMEHSYHGDTIGAMSVGARGVFNAAYAPMLFDVGRVPFPGDDPQPTYDALERECAGGAAAFIVEPLVLGAGGMLMYSPSVLTEMRRICARYDTLFIADEVMTAWGRTGTLTACEQADVVPDMMCLSKGLTGGSMPLAVTMASEPIWAAHYSNDRTRTFYHSSSYTANPIACAAANANLAIWREEPVMERIDGLCARQEAHLSALSGHPAVRNGRRCGTIAALEMGDAAGSYLSDLGPRLLRRFRDADLLLRPLGNTVYVMPPYCIDDADLDRVWSEIGAAADDFVAA
ncbi:adenosylmethionine--8-amino-7-oxononanoate transaminase [Qipengyuania sp. GH1]|uniref:adenosylmethionine--8-amino-7-oxononanoate transaminase n=1 Tax=Qipengyuania aestuarii TaxID=2867241 RepID=UPI001C879C1B|nr:adenosylmethionine--8-amino-7-oxononanoate transaminase [Qipengyuania aestuarii]MBX7534803.1 adenosylmethionine--8-amino-7-oxononanoate transaminase [Qipengyuania aestuarii]